MRLPGVIAVLTAAFAATALAGAAATHPILTSPSRVMRVAADGERVAWISGSCFTVRVRELTARRGVRLGNAAAAECGPNEDPTLALAGKRALWVVTAAGNNVYADVMTGAPGERQHMVAEVVGSSGGSDGDYLTDIAADGDVLVYSLITRRMLDTCIDPGYPCEYYVSGGRVRRVVGRSSRSVRHVPPTLAVSAQGHRIAVIVAAHDANRGPHPTGTIEVREVRSGALVSRAVAAGTPIDIALGPKILAVLTRDTNGRKIQRIRVGSGRAVGTSTVAANATDLGISGRTILYRSARTIFVLDALTGRRRVAAVARARPIGLTIEGGRILWAENLPHQSRIVWAPAH